MRAVSANLFALLFLCALASVFYVWSALETRLERHKRRFPVPGEGSFHQGLPVDLSAKTFRALLAVPGAQKPHLGGKPEARNLTDQTVSAGNRNFHVNGDNKRSARREGPVKLGTPVEDGIFWSEWLEDLFPVGFTQQYARAWRERARTYRIAKLEPGCGRISNQLATFADGSKACVRYGINADQVQGETLTYYLASLLGITNLPPLVLSQLNGDNEQWAAVRTRIDGLQWSDRAVVSLTEWVSNLTGVVTPAPLRQESSGLHPVLGDLWNKTTAELLELMQWTDLIIFDYLTANFDRLVSNLFSLQWDSRVMERDTNNLLKTPHGDLVFIDNEAGLVHGFRVLNMWEKYHNTVLSSVCVFRRRTTQRVAELHRRRDSRKRLLELYRDSEPLSLELGFLSDEHAGVLQDRIDRLYKHILQCKSKYSQL
ncbi:Four-jointed box protein 1 Four-jointed protein -like protein Precursor [Channa argus]|uniref:Four-jointed box protein 1 Four-jointed protein-like protein n=1 Tax=Channa argus TaxID=215402 RepID=A0A6G1PG68_CHAAH|nr:Four-jointed box protein 1 Four-jointed protein -like protein Precursor [Channa argus]